MTDVGRLLGELREELALSSAVAHWHGGPDPCPKCGGIGPFVKGSRQVIAISHSAVPAK